MKRGIKNTNGYCFLKPYRPVTDMDPYGANDMGYVQDLFCGINNYEQNNCTFGKELPDIITEI